MSDTVVDNVIVVVKNVDITVEVIKVLSVVVPNVK